MLKRRNVNLEPESPLTESNKQVYYNYCVYMYGSISSILPSLCLHSMTTSVNLLTLSCYLNCCFSLVSRSLSLSLSPHRFLWTCPFPPFLRTSAVPALRTNLLESSRAESCYLKSVTLHWMISLREYST